MKGLAAVLLAGLFIVILTGFLITSVRGPNKITPYSVSDSAMSGYVKVQIRQNSSAMTRITARGIQDLPQDPRDDPDLLS